MKPRNRRPPTLTKTVAVRLTKEESFALDDVALREERSVSNIVRKQIQDLLRTASPHIELPNAAERALLAELNDGAFNGEETK